MVCDALPVCGSVPLLHGCEIAEPLCVCADVENGDPLGNVVADGIDVAVFENPSRLVNWMLSPTATLVTSGA